MVFLFLERMSSLLGLLVLYTNQSEEGPCVPQRQQADLELLDEGNEMASKGAYPRIFYSSFILHPSAFILALILPPSTFHLPLVRSIVDDDVQQRQQADGTGRIVVANDDQPFDRFEAETCSSPSTAARIEQL